MFRFLFGDKRPASRSRASFRPQVEDLEGRALASGLARMTPPVQVVQVQISKQVVIADQIQLRNDNLKLEVEKAIRPLGTGVVLQGGTGSIPLNLQGGTILQRELQTAIAGQGGRVDLQRVGKVILDAARGEAKALWPEKVASGRCQVALDEVTQLDHGVLVKFRLNDVVGGTVRAHSRFEVEIKYDDKGAVTAECVWRGGQGRSFYLPRGSDNWYVQRMNKALGAPPRPAPTLAEDFF
jgi:hypothetical protein